MVRGGRGHPGPLRHSPSEPTEEDTHDTYVDLTAVMGVLREELTHDAVITYGAGNHALW